MSSNKLEIPKDSEQVINANNLVPNAINRIRRNRRKMGTNMIGETAKNRKIREQFANKDRKLETDLEGIGVKITQANIIVDTCLRFLNPEVPKFDKDDAQIRAISMSSLQSDSCDSSVIGDNKEYQIKLSPMIDGRNLGRRRR